MDTGKLQLPYTLSLSAYTSVMLKMLEDGRYATIIIIGELYMQLS